MPESMCLKLSNNVIEDAAKNIPAINTDINSLKDNFNDFFLKNFNQKK